MVRTVVGDEAQIEAFLDSLFASSASVQIGLLIGRLSTGSNRDMVFGLVPTPAKDGDQACKVVGSTQQHLGDKKKSTRARPSADISSLMLDIDWVAEHARQVSRMLLGGMYVVGIYCLGTEVSIKNSLATLWQAVRAVASTQSILADAEFVFEPLLLQISSSPRRLSCKSCLLESNFTPASIKPCEWKLGKLMSTLHNFTCHHTFNIRLPLLENKDIGKDQPLRQLLLYEIQHEVERLKTAPVLVDGIMAEENVLVLGNASDTLHDVQFLLPFNQEESREGVVVGIVSLHGTVHARSYALLREPLTRALSYLKEDIVASLRSRVDLLCDVAEQELENAQLGENGSEMGTSVKENGIHALLASCSKGSFPCSFLLPRRVLVPWSSGVFISDYLLESETIQDVNERCRELFGRNDALELSMVVEPEVVGSFAAMDSINPGTRKPTYEKIVGTKDLDSHCNKEKFPALVHAREILNKSLQYTIIGALTALLLGVLIALSVWKHSD